MQDQVTEHVDQIALMSRITSFVKSLSLSTKIIIGFALPLLLMSIVSTTVYFSTNSLIETSKWVQHTQEVITKGHLLEKLIVDMETGERGFLITGKDSFLEPFILAEEEWLNVIRNLKLLVQDNPAQVVIVESINEKFGQWIKLAASPEIIQRKKVKESLINLEHIQTILQKRTGKVILDETRLIIEGLQQAFEKSKNQTAQKLLVAISTDVVDMESGKRDFLLMGKQEYLQPYERGSIAVSLHIKELKDIIAAGFSPELMLEKIVTLRVLTDKWRTEVGAPEIQLRRDFNGAGSTMNDVTHLVEKGTGKKIIDAIRADVKRFIDVETSLINARTIESDQAILIAQYQTIFGTLAAILIAVLSAVILLRTILSSLQSISAGTQRIAMGDYSSPIVIESNDQIGALGISFNEMAIQLRDSLEEMAVSQKDLGAQKAAMDEHSLVSITDIRGTIIYANDKFCEVSGYSRGELIGTNHRMLNSDNEPEEYWRQMYLMVSKGTVWNDEVRNQAKDGHFYWVDTTIVPLYDRAGKLSGYTSIRTDISISKFVERELIVAKEDAEKATLAKTAFLATMSHEIRTPMNGVLGMAQLLQDTQLDNQQKDYLSTISSSGNSLLSIINDILDFSKLEVDKATLEAIEFDLEEICTEVLELSVGNASESNVEFVFDYEPGCPRGYVGDPSKIRQVLINLIGNAVKFTQEGLIRLGVIDLGEGEFRVEVEDTGIGLKSEACEHLFDEFTQADNSTTREFGGTGLGLAITNKLVLLMGGEIGVNSLFGEGSTFYFTLRLPLAKMSEIEPDSSLEGVRILLVDDNETSRRIFKRQLKHMGSTPTVIKNPADALEVIRKAESDNEPFEVVVLDHNMQGVSGLELGMNIRKSYSVSDLKLFMLCSIGTRGDVANFSSAGFNAGLNKPARYEVIQSMLSAVLKHCQGDHMITRYSINDDDDDDDDDVKKAELSFNAKILLVEDVEANQLVAKLMLQALGISVDIVCNGLKAIEQYQQNHDYDLIFMDCRMPVLDGYEATMAIRQIELEHDVKSPIPIVALTANTGSDERSLCKAAGMDDIVTKPIDKTELVSALLRNLSESSQSRSLPAPKPSEEVDTLDELETLNDSILDSLRDVMGESYQEMLDITFIDLQTRIDDLMQATAGSPIDDVTLWSHSVKSLAGNIGAMRLSALAKELEANSKENGVDGLNDTFIRAIKDLHNEFENLRQEMELAVS